LRQNKNELKQNPDKIFCPYCKKFGKKSTHHILPQRYFGDVGKTVMMCRKCHDLIEKMITEQECLAPELYIEIFEKFERRMYDMEIS
jgi:C4-type Zn-finger protein